MRCNVESISTRQPKKSSARPLLDRVILGRATVDAVRKLDPRQQVKNP
ncbi:MAG: hypothetical protein KJZ93_07715, partial [Caldilineaceae bacterium]|nr:hypothetical protein [Caldilineaceae bacterium]